MSFLVEALAAHTAATICGLGSTHTGLPAPIQNHSTVTWGTPVADHGLS